MVARLRPIQGPEQSGASPPGRLKSSAGFDLIVNNGGIESKLALTEMPLAGMSLYPKFV